MKLTLLAAGPWVGGPMTRPHRLVLVARAGEDGKPDALIEYYESEPRQGSQEFLMGVPVYDSGKYYHPAPGEDLGMFAVARLQAFQRRVFDYTLRYKDHILLDR